jgi:hypothetical protein
MATDYEITILQRVGFRPHTAGVLAALKVAGWISGCGTGRLIAVPERVGFCPRTAGVLAPLKELAGYQSMALEDVSQVSHPSRAARNRYLIPGSW